MHLYSNNNLQLKDIVMNVKNKCQMKEENSFAKFVKEVAKYFIEFLDTDF